MKSIKIPAVQSFTNKYLGKIFEHICFPKICETAHFPFKKSNMTLFLPQNKLSA